MAKWFKDFPTSLKSGTDRIRSASESGAHGRPKPIVTVGTGGKGSVRKNSENGSNGGGMGSLLSGRNRKNSAIELGRNHPSPGASPLKDGKIWEIFTPGKGKKNPKFDMGFEDHRTLRTSTLAGAYINRMIKVDKQDKNQKSVGNGDTSVVDSEKGKATLKTETVRFSLTLFRGLQFVKLHWLLKLWCDSRCNL